MAKLKGIKLLIVDMDNTLCDTFHTLSKVQWEKAAKVLDRNGYTAHARVFRKNLGRFSFKHTIEQLNLPEKERALAVKAYDSVAVKHLRLYKDANGILDLPFKKVLVTRGEVSLQRKKLRHLKIRKHFDAAYYIPTFKPKEEAFRKILKIHRLKPHEALVIGDRIEEEIKDANKLGIPSVLVRRPDWPVHRGIAFPTITINSLHSLQRYLK
jgi:putative hydrolase of the HAD superfamily